MPLHADAMSRLPSSPSDSESEETFFKPLTLTNYRLELKTYDKQ